MIIISMKNPPAVIRISISEGNELILVQTTPHIDECKIIISKMVGQAVRDFVNFAYSTVPTEMEHAEAAKNFLFDDEFIVTWDNKDRNLKDFLDILDIDVTWFREMVLKKFCRKWKLDDK